MNFAKQAIYTKRIFVYLFTTSRGGYLVKLIIYSLCSYNIYTRETNKKARIIKFDTPIYQKKHFDIDTHYNI